MTSAIEIIIVQFFKHILEICRVFFNFSVLKPIQYTESKKLSVGHVI
jgi:hypothetical protein